MNGYSQKKMLKFLQKYPGMRGITILILMDRGELLFRLTATLPTKVGGENNVLARTMNFEFLRPVFTGDTIICEVTVEKYEKQDNNRISILAFFLCTNQNEKQVLKGSFAGVIL